MGNELKPIVFEVDVESSPVRRLERSGLSFAASLIFHLSLFLFLSFYLISSNARGLISLELDNVEDVGVMEEISAIIEFDSSEEVEAMEMENDLLIEESEDMIGLPTDLMADLSELEEFSLEDIEAEDLLGGEFEETSNGEGSLEGGGRTGGFFGIEATGDRVVYLIDMSPSMQQGYGKRRFDRAVDEVLESVNELGPDQEFLVILFCFRMYAMNIDGLGKYCKPTAENKKKLSQWLDSAGLAPGTDPREALVAALKKKPSCCFLLSDGEFNGRRYVNPPFKSKKTAVALARLHNKHECPIHTIGLEDRGSQKMMTTIAKQSGGTYKFVPGRN